MPPQDEAAVAATELEHVDKVVPVLFEREGKRKGQLVGRSPYMQAVHALAPKSLMGLIAEVRIVAGHANSLAGERMAPA